MYFVKRDCSFSVRSKPPQSSGNIFLSCHAKCNAVAGHCPGKMATRESDKSAIILGPFVSQISSSGFRL